MELTRALKMAKELKHDLKKIGENYFCRRPGCIAMLIFVLGRDGKDPQYIGAALTHKCDDYRNVGGWK